MRSRTSNARAVGYIRVSTDQQRDSGLGLDAQRAAIQQAASRHQLTVADVFADAGLSGSLRIEDRPALADTLNALRRGDTLIVAKRDRLARDATLGEHAARPQRLADHGAGCPPQQGPVKIEECGRGHAQQGTRQRPGVVPGKDKSRPGWIGRLLQVRIARGGV